MTTTYTSKYASGAAVDAALDKAGTAVQPDDLGTAAALDVPATGNADTDEVVLGSDTRLSDARTPTAHGHTVAVPTGEGQADGYMSYQDKAKLNGIESGATADQTAQEIATLIDADATAESTLKSALGLGSAAYTASTAYATAAQGGKADSALQPASVNDTPADGATTAPISSNWAYDHLQLLHSPAPYGVSWDETTDAYETLGSPVAHLTLPLQSRMRRCLLSDVGQVTAYLDSANSAYLATGAAADLTGASGQVMVEIPKFYVSYSYAGTKHTWLIADQPLTGFTVHPAFVKNGAEVPYRYTGAYEASVVGGKILSVSGVEPTRSLTRAQFRAAAVARGAGWRQTDFTLRMAIVLLALVEYKSFNFKDAARMTAGRTVLSGGSWTLGSYVANTGLSNGKGNGTGGVSNGGSAGYATDYMTYRGIENFFGHIWEFVEGLTIDATANNESTDIPMWWTNDQAYFAATGSTGMTKLCDAKNLGSTDEGYVKTLMPDLAFGFIPKSVGASDITKVRMYYWQYPDSGNGWRVPLVGAGARSGALAGPLAFGVGNPASYADVAVGSRAGF